MRKKGVVSLILLSFAFIAGAQSPTAVLEIDGAGKKTAVSPNLYGIFYEDINFAADGGLYAELIQNRSFEYKFATESWDTLKGGESRKPRIKIRTENPLNPQNPKYAQIERTSPGMGVVNAGFGGIAVKEGKKYPGSIWLRSPGGEISSVAAALDSGSGETLSSASIKGIGTEWKKFEFTLSPTKDSSKAKLIISPDQNGILDMDMVSLFPPETYKNRENGFRTDLAVLLEELNPGFMRFPGGCVVEGRVIEEAYRWKDTIGPVEERKEAPNFWGYQQTYGIGFHEYFQFCEDIGADAVPIVNCHMSFADRDIPYINLKDLPDLKEWIQDAIDVLEYANGPAASKWGALRAKNGHPAPFNVKYLGIGNEQFNQSYFDRYEAFAKEIKKVYPEVKLILSSGPLPSGIIFDSAWMKAREFQKEGLVDLIDEHYYCPPEWFLANTKRYDSYDRSKTKVFLGEYAAHADGRRNNMFAAIAEAAFMTGLERNGDVVEMASYAPLFAKEGNVQWAPDMIWFDNEKAWTTPSYWVQKMFADRKSEKTLASVLTVDSSNRKPAAIGGSVGLGTWATRTEYADIMVKDADGKVLYDGRKAKIRDWKPLTGSWSAKKNAIVQDSSGTDCRILLDAPGWDGYTFSMKARKTDGAEGMLVMFGVKDRTWYWWNIGGWNNTQSAIEKGTGESKGIIGESVPVSIEAGRWYDIRVEVYGAVAKCYLDGRLVHTISDAQAWDPVFAHAGEAKNGDIIIKLVNADGNKNPVRIKLANVGPLQATASAVVLAGAKDAENTAARPEAVLPAKTEFQGVSQDFTVTLEPWSASILTLKKK
ncbi:hypothetical protein K7J14_14435 [Treponema zuelzerae]|uniref:non-reducing end alpha-L-arabinofuranosidase n=1 Tax=Teretinema zuelzerae TaxID=156 RepID=A0AAE3ELH6_9SPIR|nr:alpha-L-arabinofuranosidase C-terminal domain-containing protein [Teretinema zuelzerae]MCD1655893.1 hypothetical protein [Teretinema zuelzerae]